MKKRDVVDYRYLAKTTSPIISIASTYIAFVTKMQKGKPIEIDLPFLKTISQIFYQLQN